MTHKLGTNQHEIKYKGLKTTVVRDIFIIAFFITLGAWILTANYHVISPCPDSGCGAHFVKAGDPPNLTPREIVLLEGLRVFGITHLQALENLINKESHFNPWAINQSSGACGMFQALPCSKMKCDMGDSVCQAKWGINYILKRYGNPTVAWQFHLEHNWY